MPKITIAATASVSILLVRGLPQKLVAAGWDVTLLSAPGPQLDAYRGVPGVKVRPVPMRREPSPLNDIIAVRKLMKFLRTESPDVVFYGTPKVSLLMGIAGLLTRQPHRIYILRGLRLEGTSGLKRLLLAAAERVTTMLSSAVISVSPSLTQTALQNCVVAPAKIRTFGRGSSNGVDLAALRPMSASATTAAGLAAQLGLDAELPTIGFVGRVHVSKGIGDLLNACQIMAASGQKFQLLLLGGHDGADLVSELSALQSAGVKVCLAGQVDITAEHYAVMSVMCLPTYREGFPNVVLEAAACGVPTVTTRVTGAVDSVVDGETGYLVPAHSPEDLATALTALLDDDASRVRMGNAAREHVAQHFDREIVQQRFVDFFTERVSNTAS